MTHGTEAIIGESRAIRELREMIRTVAPTRLAVLIQGPTGSGKELVAAALHSASGRRGAFVPFNVCAIGETMFEDALFGHVRGAFTGASTDVPGYLREANGGTAFFDEISDLQPALQTKLLRAIETGVFRPVGAKYDARSDVRVVTATNQSLQKMVGEGRFRPDLAHRIGGVIIDVPPLSDRLEDLPFLVQHFLQQAGVMFTTVSTAAVEVLAAYDWPGNVRELRNVVQWAAVLCNGALNATTTKAALARVVGSNGARIQADATFLERRELREMLERHDWDAQLTARELGIHRATLYRRIKRLGIAISSTAKPERLEAWTQEIRQTR